MVTTGSRYGFVWIVSVAASIAVGIAAAAPRVSVAHESGGGMITQPFAGAAIAAPLARDQAIGCRAGERLAWLIWGRRGKSKRVAKKAIAWPVGRVWPKDGASVNRWGKIFLAASEAPPAADAADVLMIPRGEIALAVDGALMGTEWSLASAKEVPTPAGPMLVTGRWQDNGLAIAVALPWVPALSPRAEVVLVLGPQPSDASGLPSSARAYKIVWDARRQRSVLSVALAKHGKWQWREVREEDINLRKGFRGGVSDLGDGGVPFLAAEFLIPLTGPLAPGEGAKELTGAVFVLHAPTSGKARDAVMWPAAHGPALERSESLLLEHPDGWGRLARDEDAARRGDLVLASLETAPELDGDISADEWAGASEQEISFAKILDGSVRVGVHGARLFVALECKPTRQKVASPVLELYFDPAGDGGLLPRADDRLVVFAASSHGGEVLSWHMPPGGKGEKVVTSEGDWNMRESRAGDWAWKINDGTLTVEAAVPLSAIGLDPEQLPDAVGFLLRLCYDVSFTMKK